MGFNTTAIILNDALDDIRNDRQIGEKIYEGVLTVDRRNGSDVPARIFGNAIRIVETHHADEVALIAVGGNTAQIISNYICGWKQLFEEDTKVVILKHLADELGYRVIKK